MTGSTGSARLAPWTGRDAAVAAGAGGLGAVTLVAAWAGASGATTLAQQTGWISTGIGGILFASVGGSYWFLQGRRTVSRRRRAWIVGERNRRAANERRAVGTDGAQFVAGVSMTRYHRPGCPLVSGKPVLADAREAHEQGGRRSCGVCRP